VPRVDEMARMLGMSRESLTRSFRDATGRSPADAFRAMQIARAKELLISTDDSTKGIACATAFGSVRAFYRTFRRCVGVTPTQYRQGRRRPKQ
jgi:AraC family transcriptional activator FtrA